MLNAVGMERKRVAFATTMSWFLAIAMIAGCEEGTDIDPLAGPTECNGFGMCGSGELCRDQWIGPREDGGVEHGCVAVPAGCEIVDCIGWEGSGCPTCTNALCEPPYNNHPRIDGRHILCSN